MSSFFEKLKHAFYNEVILEKEKEKENNLGQELSVPVKPTPSTPPRKLPTSAEIWPVAKAHPEDLDVNKPIKEQVTPEEYEELNGTAFNYSELLFRRRLRVALEREQFYLNPDMNLEKLAQMIRSNRTYLLRHLNSIYGDSYAVVINQFRIAYALQLMEEKPLRDDRMTKMYSRCGYKNNITFHRNFYRFTGMSTSEWYELQRAAYQQASPQQTDTVKPDNL